ARGHAVGIEHRLDVAQSREHALQLLHVADLGDVPVLGHLILRDAAVLDDVAAVLGKVAADVLQQPRAAPAVYRDLHAERLARLAVPADGAEALGRALESAHV